MSSNFPHALALPHPIVGTIEFDVDPELATWLDVWRSNGGANRRKGSTIVEGGVKELKLVKRLQGKQRFLRELDPKAQSPTRREFSDPNLGEEADISNDPSLSRAQYLVLDDDEGFGTTPDVMLDEIDPLSGFFPSAASEFAALRASRSVHGERRLSIKNIGSDRILSASPSFGEFAEDDISGELEVHQEIQEVISMLRITGVESDELLASPIDFGRAEDGTPELRVMDMEIDRRGSGLVMSDQLDDLEKREQADYCEDHIDTST